MHPTALRSAAATIPPGRWAVGVSGGADSVALLRLLAERKDLSLHVAHLDHETREGESAVDARFVVDLAGRLGVAVTVARRCEVEKTMGRLLPNVAARFRAARIEFFKQVVAANDSTGVILAHHADDQAETVFHRLIRGSGPEALRGILPRTKVRGLRIVRPLLLVRSTQLRDYLQSLDQHWREDSSNRSNRYQRNQLRMILADKPGLHEGLIELGFACGDLWQWIAASAPMLGKEFGVEKLAGLAAPVARFAAGRWLVARGSPVEKIDRSVCEQLVRMTTDMATPARQYFPGRVLVRRRKGIIFAEVTPRP